MFPFLKILLQVYEGKVKVVTVMISSSFEEMTGFMEQNDYRWPALFYEFNENLLKQYNVKGYPTCYLLDREGNLVLSPAGLPSEGFDQQLFRILRSRGDL